MMIIGGKPCQDNQIVAFCRRVLKRKEALKRGFKEHMNAYDEWYGVTLNDVGPIGWHGHDNTIIAGFGQPVYITTLVSSTIDVATITVELML